MRKGGGQAKGSAFERESCLGLSLWVSQGKRTDLFTRNVLSGGRFTIAMARQEDHGTPGDTMASHPMAFAFASTFLVECKSYKDLGWTAFLHDEDKSFLGRVIKLCRSQAAHVGQDYIVIAKQNQRKPVLMMDRAAGLAALDTTWRKSSLQYHWFHRETIFALHLESLTYIRPDDFIEATRKARLCAQS